MNKKILIITYGGGHVNIVKSIYHDLAQVKNLHIEILALTTAAEELSRHNIPNNTIKHYINFLDNKREILRYGKVLAQKFHNSDSTIDLADSIVYYGIGFSDLTKLCGYKIAKHKFITEGRKAFEPISSMEKIVSKINPDALIIPTGVRLAKAAAIVSSRKKIPVIKINDYPIMDKLDYKAKICVMNEWAKKYLLENGIANAKDIIITGQPVFERNLQLNNDTVAEYRQKVKKDYKRVVLYLGQNVAEMGATVVKLLDISNLYEDMLIFIRPHPNDYNHYSPQGYFPNCEISKDGELKYLIAISDLVIAHTSTGGIEAALLGKPVISVLINSKPKIKLKDFGIAREVNDLNELQLAIDECLNSDSEVARELMYGRFKFKNTDNATNNIIGLIKEVVWRGEDEYEQ